MRRGRLDMKWMLEYFIYIYQAIKEHIEVKAVIIKRLKSILKKSHEDSPRVILGYMLSDEPRHHSIFKKIVDHLI